MPCPVSQGLFFVLMADSEGVGPTRRVSLRNTPHLSGKLHRVEK